MPANLKYDQAVLITRNNSWLVPRTCEIAEALAARGIKISLIAYTGSTPDSQFSYLNSSSYLPLDQLAQKYGMAGAVRISKMGEEGRKHYHDAVTALPNLGRTLGVSVDTRLIIGKDTLKLVPHHGFHPGRMKAMVGKLKALGDAATIKMVHGAEIELHGAAHLLGGEIDSGGTLGHVTISVKQSDSMYQVRDKIYRAEVAGYINMLDMVLDPSKKITVTPQHEGPEYPEVTEESLRSFLPGWKGGKVPHERLIKTEQFLASLAHLLPPGASITEIPDPLSIGITSNELREFESANRAKPRAIPDYSNIKYHEDGLGLA